MMDCCCQRSNLELQGLVGHHRQTNHIVLCYQVNDEVIREMLRLVLMLWDCVVKEILCLQVHLVHRVVNKMMVLLL